MSNGDPGIDDGWSYIQDVLIDISGATLTGEVGTLPADILSGDFETASARSPYLIELPYTAATATRLTLHLYPDHRTLCITGPGVTVKSSIAPPALQLH